MISAFFPLEDRICFIGLVNIHSKRRVFDLSDFDKNAIKLIYFIPSLYKRTGIFSLIQGSPITEYPGKTLIDFFFPLIPDFFFLLDSMQLIYSSSVITSVSNNAINKICYNCVWVLFLWTFITRSQLHNFLNLCKLVLKLSTVYYNHFFIHFYILNT